MGRWEIRNSKFEIRNSDAGGQVLAGVGLIEIGHTTCRFLAGRRHHLGNHNLHGIEMIPVSSGLGVPNTFAAETEGAPGVGPGRNLRPHRSVHRSNFDLATPVGFRKSNRNGRTDVVAIAFEEAVLAHANLHEEISGLASRTTLRSLSGNPHPLPIPYPLGDLDPKSLGRDQHPRTVTARAGPFVHGAAAIAGCAHHLPLDGNCDRGTALTIDKGDFDLDFLIGTAARLSPCLRCPATAKELTKDVAEVLESPLAPGKIAKINLDAARITPR